MKTLPFIKVGSFVLLPSLVILNFGCYSYQTPEVGDLEKNEEIIVEHRDGSFYRLSSWESDGDGNLTGSGLKCPTRDDAMKGIRAEYFAGTLAARDIVSIGANRPDTGANMVLFVLSAATLVGISLLLGALGEMHG